MNHHDKMNEAFHKAEKKMAGKSSGGYDMHMDTLAPKGGKANGSGGDNKFAEKGQRFSEKNNRTSYGSKTIGADIDGGIED